MNKDAFSGFHPAVNLAFFLAALGMTMLVQHPVYLLISLVSGCAYHTIKEVVDDDIRALIESELILAVIHKYDLSRVPKDQSPT